MTQPQTINCPTCGGDVPISTAAARVAGCPYCESTLIVNEAAIRSLGKMALLAETPSCLAVGYHARCLKREIRVLGRIQYRYHSGLWDEWWVQFLDDDSHAWISQDEAEYILERPLSKLQAPDYDSISPGDRFEIAGHKLWVEEKDRATMVGLQGELPLDAAPERQMRYVELTDNELLLTIEYFEDGSYEAFQGRKLKRTDLEAIDAPDEDEGWGSPYAAPQLKAPPLPMPGLAGAAGKEQPPEVITSAAGVRPQSANCPGCGGAVELRDQQGTAMVTCQYCDAVMDVTVPGTVQLLYHSEQRKLPFPIPIGATGKLEDAEWTVVGRVRYREDDPSGVWVWDELQLFNPQRGYRFLALEEGHWMWFERLRHRVELDPRFASPKQKFTLQGQTYKVFERSYALINYVEGELSWVARLGDRVGYMDAIRPPQMVSAEWTENELEWSIGRYLPRAQVANAFGIDIAELPKPQGVGPAQPFKRTEDQSVRAWSGLTVGLLLIFLCAATFFVGRGTRIYSSGPIHSSQYLTEQGFISKPFEVPAGNHVCKLTARSNGVNNSWVGMAVAFLDEDERVVMDADSQVEYYHGVQGGESWSEGSKSDSTLFRLKGPQKYHLNVFGEAGKWSRVGGDRKTPTGPPVQLEIHRDVVPARYFLIGAIIALIYPIWEFARGIIFESSRWPSEDD